MQLHQRISKSFNLREQETPAVLAGFLVFFLLFTGYFMLRPVRETMGIAGGVRNLQWLFTGTFAATLLVLPLFGWLAAKVPRRRILPYTYGFFALNLLIFAFLLMRNPNSVWVARSFYIWLSVFNLLTISLAWSVLVDLFSVEQGKRLFALIAGGASLGGLSGPLLGAALVAKINHAGLLLLSAGFVLSSIVAAAFLQRWRDMHPLKDGEEAADRSEPLGGNPFAGATAVLRSPYLLGISVFVLLLTSVSTFLYFEQARLVAQTFPDPTKQTQVFGLIDMVVQSFAILTQIFLTGRIAEKFGVGALLCAVPIAIAVGFLLLAANPVFWVLAVVIVLRRAGEYALVRPGREMLYSVVSTEEKYKGKNVIDTAVYRGGDAISGWLKRALDIMSENPSQVLSIGAGIALLWGICGWRLAAAYQHTASVKR